MMMHLFKSCLSPVRRQEGRRLMMFSHSLPYIAPYKVQYRTKLGDRPEHPYQMSFNDTRNNYKFKGVKYEDFVKYFNRYGCSYSRANFYDNY